VRSVFSRLLRDPSLQIDPKPAAPDFQRYRICNGDGRVGFDDISGNPRTCQTFGVLAFTPARYRPTPQDPQSQRGYMMICRQAWERYGENGRNLGSINCSDLKAGASYIMESLTSTILHEFLHWDNLFAGVAGGPILDWNLGGPAFVIPPDGYGPFNAHWLRNTGGGLTQNSDNYVWFALETFFQNKCPGKVFTDPMSEDNPVDSAPWELPRTT
jgi:hypothetical protein